MMCCAYMFSHCPNKWSLNGDLAVWPNTLKMSRADFLGSALSHVVLGVALVVLALARSRSDQIRWAQRCLSPPLALSPLSLALSLVAFAPDILGSVLPLGALGCPVALGLGSGHGWVRSHGFDFVSHRPWLRPRCPKPWLWSRLGSIAFAQHCSS